MASSIITSIDFGGGESSAGGGPGPGFGNNISRLLLRLPQSCHIPYCLPGFVFAKIVQWLDQFHMVVRLRDQRRRTSALFLPRPGV